MNNLDTINPAKIQKPKLEVRKPGGNDIDWSNPYGDQATHFFGCTKNFNVKKNVIIIKK